MPKFVSLKAVFVLAFTLALLGSPLLVAQADTDTFPATQDTTIMQGGSSTWGDEKWLEVGYAYYFYTQRTLVRFDLADIPPEATITSASFEAYYELCHASETEMDLPIHRLTRDWDEDTAAWADMSDASDAHVYDTLALGGYEDLDQWVSWDVTDLVREWHGGAHPNYGLAIHGQESWPYNSKYFYSKEKGPEWAPRLVVVWDVPTPTVTPTVDYDEALYLPLLMKTFGGSGPTSGTLTPTGTPTPPLH